MCQKPNPSPTEETTRTSASEMLYPNLNELLENIFASSSEDEDETTTEQPRRTQGSRSQSKNPNNMDLRGFLDAVLGAYREAQQQRTTSAAPGNEQSARHSAQSPPSAEEFAAASAPPPPSNEQGSTPFSRGFDPSGAWTTPSTPQEHNHRYFANTSRRPENCRRSGPDGNCGPRCLIAGFFRPFASNFVRACLFLLSLFLLPSFLVAFGLFVAVSQAMHWPVGRALAAGLLLQLLTGLNPFFLSLAAGYAAFKVFVMGRPVVDRAYWRQRCSCL